MAIIIDGKELAKKIRANLKIECEELKQKNINTKLAVIMVGEDPASKIYVKNKSKACIDVGIEYEEYLVKINSSIGIIIIEGNKMNLNQINENDVLISGAISKIYLESTEEE